MLVQDFFTLELINRQTAAAAKIHQSSIKFLRDNVPRLSATVVASNCIYHSITGPITNEGIRLATANPRRMV